MADLCHSNHNPHTNAYHSTGNGHFSNLHFKTSAVFCPIRSWAKNACLIFSEEDLFHCQYHLILFVVIYIKSLWCKSCRLHYYTFTHLTRTVKRIHTNLLGIMPRTGIANLPLHGGKAPRWLFTRMVALARGIIDVVCFEYGGEEFLRRISDPFWFQALSCVLGFDWHSSGTTTVTCGALKEAVNSQDFGFVVAGGKGKASRKTLAEIETYGDQHNLSTYSIERLQYCSRMAAKVDSSAIQDGYNLYHHVLLFSEGKKWAVVQQGLNNNNSYARRYHWHSDALQTFVCEPHTAILGERSSTTLDMTASASQGSQKVTVDVVNDNPSHLQRDWAQLSRSPNQTIIDEWVEPRGQQVIPGMLTMPKSINWSKMKEIYEFQPKNYEELLSMKGVGANTVRALALISDLIYGEKPSWSDPVKFSFTVGGKDGVPYPVDRKAMDEATRILQQGVEKAKVEEKDRLRALQRLRAIIPQDSLYPNS